jgi:recombinational DNA repair protein RecR
MKGDPCRPETRDRELQEVTTELRSCYSCNTQQPTSIARSCLNIVRHSTREIQKQHVLTTFTYEHATYGN